jgi:hypothetical protein
MTALFRIVELNSGKIDVDGIDISKLGLDALRQRLSIIPQEALLVYPISSFSLFFCLPPTVGLIRFPSSADFHRSGTVRPSPFLLDILPSFVPPTALLLELLLSPSLLSLDPIQP